MSNGDLKMSATITTNSGDIAWVIAATALVMLMTPALGFFYGGLCERKTSYPQSLNASSFLP